MEKCFKKILQGYESFRKKYALGDNSVMSNLSNTGQNPKIMVLGCCDSRVDPAVILQCDPGDLFVIRNVANIIPPYEKDEARHGTSAAIEFGIRFLNIQHFILLGHSQCGGIEAIMHSERLGQNDFITHWVSLMKEHCPHLHSSEDYAKMALKKSYQNCLTFPWIQEKILDRTLKVHLWFFDIEKGEVQSYLKDADQYVPLS